MLATPALAEVDCAWLPKAQEAIASCSSGRPVLNFLGTGSDVDRCWTPEVRARLVAAKAYAGPLYIICSNRPVRGRLH